MDSAGCCGFSPPCQEVGRWRLPASSPCSPCCPQTCGRSCCGSDPSLPSQLTASLVAGPDQRSAADHHHSRSNLGFPSLSVAFSYFCPCCCCCCCCLRRCCSQLGAETVLLGGPSVLLRWRGALRQGSPGLEPPRFLLKKNISQKFNERAINGMIDTTANPKLS